MSAIALAARAHGSRGERLRPKESVALARLDGRRRATCSVGNRAENVPPDADAVVYSTAIPARNVELVAARELGIPVLHRSAALAALAATRRTIAVAGSHGKTTTSSMLALILRSAGWQPSFVIGGEVNEVGANAAYGAGEWLVVEADESDGTFLQLGPEAAIVTSVEPDHLDYYGGFDELDRRVRAVRRRRARPGRVLRRRRRRRRASRAPRPRGAHLRLRSERRLPHRRRRASPATSTGSRSRPAASDSASSWCRWP